MAKKIVCAALILVMLAPIGAVYAVDPVYVDVLDYAVCYFASNTSAPNRGTIVRQYPYTFPTSPAYPTVGYYAQLEFEPNTTYVLSWTFETDQPELFQGFFEVMEANSYTVNSNTGPLDVVSWSGSSKIDSNYIAYNQQIGDTLVITEVAFNTGNIPNLVTGLPMYVIYRGSGSVKGVTVKDFAMSAYATYDPSGDQLNSILVDMVGGIQQDLENYHTNALEVLDQIKAGQDKTNESLDKLPDTLDEALDKAEDREYDKATEDGDDNVGAAVDALNGVINVGSIMDAMQPLISACAYTGTTSVWTFPSIVLPEIPGVMDAMKLNDPINFDLTDYADQYIPSAILTLVRSLATVGLIVFGAREVMRIIKGVGTNDG